MCADELDSSVKLAFVGHGWCRVGSVSAARCWSSLRETGPV